MWRTRINMNILVSGLGRHNSFTESEHSLDLSMKNAPSAINNIDRSPFAFHMQKFKCTLVSMHRPLPVCHVHRTHGTNDPTSASNTQPQARMNAIMSWRAQPILSWSSLITSARWILGWIATNSITFAVSISGANVKCSILPLTFWGRQGCPFGLWWRACWLRSVCRCEGDSVAALLVDCFEVWWTVLLMVLFLCWLIFVLFSFFLNLKCTEGTRLFPARRFSSVLNIQWRRWNGPMLAFPKLTSVSTNSHKEERIWFAPALP